MRASLLFGLALATLLGGSAADAQPARHPLDPLSPDEIRAATALLRRDARLTRADLPFIAVAAPEKRLVLAWRPGQPVARRARALATTAAAAFEAIVDLDAGRLVSVVERPGVQGPVTLTETTDVTAIASGNARFQAGLRARGVTDMTRVFCAPWSAGYYGIPAHEGRRILVVGCFDTRRSTNNTFGWPIERLFAVVDMRAREVLDVIDGGVVPPGPSNQNFTSADVGTLRADRPTTVLAQPAGASYRIDGHEVQWGRWRFHVRIDPRVGPVISLARWRDGNAERSVLYEGHLSEMFVPYMDPDVGWYSRTFFDAGEYGAGLLASPLTPGVDCPASAGFLPATLNTDRGEPLTTPRALCVFERDRGEPLWRHEAESRRDVELVVRMAAVVGNYDYLLDWVFNDAAEIDVRVGATGIIALKGVATQSMGDATAAADTRYGTLVAPGLVGTTHDHHFNFRLDLDVDGTANSFAEDVLVPSTLPAASPRRSLYSVARRFVDSEASGRIDTGHATAKLVVVNESRLNGVGNPVGYELLYANHGGFLLSADDWPAKRARFLEHDLWVTPYDPAELHAAGDYPFASREPAGLAVWSAKDRPTRRRDLVIWTNLSLHHVTRSEDQPVMPTLWHSFKIRPFNFFDRNPALDLPPEPAAVTATPARGPR